MLALGAERQSPFQMRPIQNPFSRVVSAVENIRDQVVANVREVGTNITHRIQRTQVAAIDSSRMTLPVDYSQRAQDVRQLEQARATIATAVPRASLRGVSETSGVYPEQGRREAISHQHSAKKAIIHGVVEATKNSAPSMIVGAGARVALGAGFGLLPVAVAMGASAASRATREGVRVLRKGAFDRTTQLITKHEEARILHNFDGSERVTHSGIRARQDQFAQTGIGKVTNAMLHGGEKMIAEFAYGKQWHARALINAQYKDVSYLSDKELIKLREHAVVARMTHGTACDVYEMRQLAKTTYQSVNRELAKRGIDRRDAHEQQLRLYKKDVRIGAAFNVLGQAGLAAVKAIPKTFATFFITDAFLKAINVDTSNRHNPLEGFENTRLGRAIGSAIAPKSVASAEELNPGMPHITQPVSTSVISDQTTEAQRFGPPDPRLTTTVRVENGETIIEGKGVLSSGSPKAVDPSYAAAPREPSFVRAPVADRVAIASEVNVVAPMREVARTLQEVQEYTIEGKVSWTQDIFDRKLLSGMQDAAHSMDWYGAPGTAERMVKEVFAVNPDLMDANDMQEIQEYLATHPNASFVQMWKDLQHTVFSDDMDKLTDGTAYKVLSEHTVVVQDPIAEINEEDAIVMGARRASKPPGLARYVLSTDQQTAPPTSLQSSGTNTSGYQVVRPPQSTGVPSGANTIQGTYQQVAPPGGNTAASGTVNGFQQVRKPGEIISNNGTTGGQAVVSPQNSIVPPPHHMGSPDTGSAASNTLHGYQQVAPPGSNSAISNSSAVGTYQEVGQPSAPRTVVVARSANESFQIVSPPRPQEDVSFQVVSLPRAVLPYEVSRDTQLASIVGPFDLSSGNSHVAYLESTNSYFPSSSSMPISMLNDRAPAIGAGAYEFNALGGTNIWTHTSSFKEGGRQWLEDARVYMQGGNGQPRLGPVQQLHRAQELLQSAPHLFINIDNQHQGGFSLTGVNHLLLNSDGSLDLFSTDGIIGGGPDTLSFIGCSYGHVQAIQMIIDHSAEAPTHLNQWFAILNDPYATGASVENAVDQIVKQWYSGTAYYSDFYNLYGYLLEEIPTPGTSEYTEFLNNLANNGYMSSGRLEFEFTIGGQ